MPSSNAPIGVFDSGLGGLSVAGRFFSSPPYESLLYYADTAHVPYGGRPLEEVKSFALSICDYLVSEGAKMIVMACNISSAIALSDARRRHPDIPMLGVVEPGSAAAIATGAERIGVLATQGTVSSGAYTRTLQRLREGVDVIEAACPRFVPLVESGATDSDAAREAAIEYLTPLAASGCTTVILGCTHYPFLLPALKAAAEKLYDDSLPIFLDPAHETVRTAEQVLESLDLTGPFGMETRSRFCVSADPDQFRSLAPVLLGAPIDQPELVTLQPVVAVAV